MPFFRQTQTGYDTTVRHILIAKRFFAEHPDGKIETGMWTEPAWGKADFYRWFRRCLMHKCGGGEYTERQRALIADGQRINDYYSRRIRHHGTGWLSTPKMKKRYPHINNQPFND